MQTPERIGLKKAKGQYKYKYQGFEVDLFGVGDNETAIYKAIARQMFLKLGDARMALVRVAQDETGIVSRLKGLAMKGLKESR